MPCTPNDPDALSSPVLDRSSLQPDCGNCFALCCTALGFSRTTDFAIDKPAGTPCRNLTSDFSCTIHDSLRPRGFRGCTVFDCFGAGQNVSQNLFHGISWRAEPGTARTMFPVFKTARHLHEMLWYLAEAVTRTFDPDTVHKADALRGVIEDVLSDTEKVLSFDAAELQVHVRSILLGVSEEVRASYLATGNDHLESVLAPGSDLMGKNLRSRSLCGAELRGACLIAADVRDCDLSGADLLGVDLRDTRVDGADLSRALYLTQAQVNAALGDARTLLPDDLDTPAHWV